MATAELDNQVVVTSQSQLHVFAADHDFTKFSITPSVVLFNNTPPKISGLWYDCQVHVMFEDAAFEPSSPVRHSDELYNINKEKALKGQCFSFTQMRDQTIESPLYQAVIDSLV